jgi:CRP-like cAMP-binding protein
VAVNFGGNKFRQAISQLCVLAHNIGWKDIAYSRQTSMVLAANGAPFMSSSTIGSDFGSGANQLLAKLPPRQRQQLLQYCMPVELSLGRLLYQAGKPISHLYWPVNAVLSLVAELPGHLPFELALIGHEGMLGASTVLGVSWAPVDAIVQGRGLALQLPAAQLPLVLSKVPALATILQHYLVVQQAQAAMLSACVHFHQLQPRLARWLLMTADRTNSKELFLTHDFLASMLGVRRSGITVAAGRLQQLGLISYHRGTMKMVNRQGLEAEACCCYQQLKHWYQFGFSQPLPKNN